MEKEIYIVRHGRTDYNRRGVWQGSGVDAPLDEEGIRQADAFYKAYAGEDFDLVIYSELRRSKQTVQRFMKEGMDHLEMSEINEISWGIYEGKPHTDASYKAYRDMIAAWSQGELQVGLEGGENAAHLLGRMRQFREAIETLTYKKILICSHGRAIRALIAILKDEDAVDMEKYEHANTGVFRCTYRNGVFSFLDYNNTDHLIPSS